MNKVWEIGRLTKEPEIRYTSKKNGNGEEESTVTAIHLLLQEDTGMRMDSRTQIFSAALPLERTLSLRKNTFIRELRSLFPDICILAVTQTKTGLKFIT